MEAQNASNDAPEDKPTSKWDYSHCVQPGDRFVTEDGDHWDVVSVRGNGSVRALSVEYDEAETWNEEEVRTSLAHDEMKRVSDGKGHELATF